MKCLWTCQNHVIPSEVTLTRCNVPFVVTVTLIARWVIVGGKGRGKVEDCFKFQTNLQKIL